MFISNWNYGFELVGIVNTVCIKTILYRNPTSIEKTFFKVQMHTKKAEGKPICKQMNKYIFQRALAVFA